MPVCEICGAEVEKLSRARVEDSVLEVCKNCASLGEVLPDKLQAPAMHAGAARVTSIPSGAPAKSIDFDEVVVPGFSKIIKDARERQKIDFKALAEKLKIKEQLLHRVEQGRLVPDLGLAKKLERALNVKVVERIEDE